MTEKHRSQSDCGAMIIWQETTESNCNQRGAVESLMETIRLCLCHAAEEDEE